MGTLRIRRNDKDEFTIEAVHPKGETLTLSEASAWPVGAVLDIETDESVGPIAMYVPEGIEYRQEDYIPRHTVRFGG